MIGYRNRVLVPGRFQAFPPCPKIWKMRGILLFLGAFQYRCSGYLELRGRAGLTIILYRGTFFFQILEKGVFSAAAVLFSV